MYTEARIMTERVKGLESRLAATESRLTALESRAEGCITQDEYRARLAALRAPGEGRSEIDAAVRAEVELADLVELRPIAVDGRVATAEAQRDRADRLAVLVTELSDVLAAERRERDEAVSCLRFILALSRTPCDPNPDHECQHAICSHLRRARALVTGRAAPTGGIDWEKTAQSRQDVIAVKDREIAALRALLDAAGRLIERARKLIERLRKLVPSSGHVYIPSDVVADLHAWGKAS